MIEFGKTLRLAREAKGYTVAQVAELTKLAPTTVQELEDENFSRIAAPIYGRGFVKLYCEAVGLEAKPLVDEFMSIYKGDRDLGIRERKVAEPAAPEPPPIPPPMPAEEPAIVPPPAPAAEPEPVQPQSPIPDLSPNPEPAPEPSLFHQVEPPPPVSIDPEPPPPADPFSFQNDREQAQRPDQRTLSRYAAPVRTMHAPSVPPAVWRIAILGTLALLVLWGVAVGVRTLYRATTSNSPTAEKTPEPPPPPPAAKPAPATPPAAAKAKPATPPPATKAKPATPPPAAKAKPATPPPAAKAKPAPAKTGKTTNRKTQKIPSIYAD